MGGGELMPGLTNPLPVERLKQRLSEHTQTDKGLVRAVFWLDVAYVCQVYRASLVGGPRTPERNRVVNGSPESKHTEAGGWGCAADLWFDLAHSRDGAIEALHDHGWHTYVGPHYSPRRLHVQAFAYGVAPEPNPLGPPHGAVAGT